MVPDMGAKSRAAMEEARRRLEDLGPTAPPCDNPACNPFGKASSSNGIVLIRLPGGGSVAKNACSPLRCAWDLAGPSLQPLWSPHPPGRYREA